jgi:chromatin remodeling complex protein RSC6
MLNDLLVEALTNNFVLANLVNYEILNDSEGALISNSRNMLLEDSEYVMINMKSIFENAKARIQSNPLLLQTLIKDFIEEEYERDYKKEYKNYHGKSKQRKERASRTKAREEMIKKGRAKKGDGKDIDHKKALRSGGSNGINNLRVRDRSANRSDNGHHEGEKQNKDSWK